MFKNYQTEEIYETGFYLIHFIQKILYGSKNFDKLIASERVVIKENILALLDLTGITSNKTGELDYYHYFNINL